MAASITAVRAGKQASLLRVCATRDKLPSLRHTTTYFTFFFFSSLNLVEIVGVFIARQVGIISEQPFPYRFNDMTPTERQLALRSMKHATSPCSITAHTFAVQVPCRIANVFDQFPFRMVHAGIEVTLASRLVNDLLHAETGQNQQVKH